MKYRSILGGIALIGLVAVTGCSRGALHENNEGNYNGERLVRSITRNADGEYGNRATRGFTRGMNRNTRHNYDNRRNDTGLGTQNRDYLNSRTHRADRDYLAGDLALNCRGDNDCIVPAMAVDNEEANAISDFFAFRRNRQPEATPEVPAPAPQVTPAVPEGATDEVEINTEHDVTEEEYEETEAQPEPTPVPAKQGTSVERLMK